MRIGDCSSDVCSSYLNFESLRICRRPAYCIGCAEHESNLDPVRHVIPLHPNYFRKLAGCVGRPVALAPFQTVFTQSRHGLTFNARADFRSHRDTRAPHASSVSSRRSAFLQPTRHKLLSRSRSEEHTSELQSLMRISYAVFCL